MRAWLVCVSLGLVALVTAEDVPVQKIMKKTRTLSSQRRAYDGSTGVTDTSGAAGSATDATDDLAQIR